jgi:prephenate dehydrogenase
MRIAVLGGAGGMGRLFLRYFSSFGHDLVVSDPSFTQDCELQGELQLEIASSNLEAVVGADTVIVSVPMGLTVPVIREIVSSMKPGSILCEVSSIKANAHAALQAIERTDIKTLCIHPLFGPGADDLRKKYALIPVHDANHELELASTVFPGWDAVVVEVQDHDRTMALTISLPYFLNLIMVSVLQGEDMKRLQTIGGTTFRIQLLVASSVMFNSCSLHEGLHKANPYALDILKSFRRQMSEGMATLLAGTTAFMDFCSRTKTALEAQVDLAEQYSQMYRLLDGLDDRLSSEVSS